MRENEVSRLKVSGTKELFLPHAWKRRVNISTQAGGAFTSAASVVACLPLGIIT